MLLLFLFCVSDIRAVIVARPSVFIQQRDKPDFFSLFVAYFFCKIVRETFSTITHLPLFFFSKFAVLWTLPAAEVITLFDKSLSPFRPSLSGAILKPPWKLTFATALVWKEPQTSSWAVRSDVKRSVFLKSGRATHKFWAKRWGMSEPGVTQAHQHCVITFKPLKWASQKLGSEAFHSKFWLKWTECFLP